MTTGTHYPSGDPFDHATPGCAPALLVYLERAAAWRSRLERPVAPLSWQSEPARLLILPPELWGLGQVAATLAMPFGCPLYLAPAPVGLGQAPVAALRHVPPAALLAQLAPGAPTFLPPSLTTAETRLALDGTDHPVTGLRTLLQAAGLQSLLPLPTAVDPAAVAYLDHCLPTVSTAANPAKQLALHIHQRVTILVADPAGAGLAHDWSVRLHWRAEAVAWALSSPDLARIGVLARLPRYWPNSACYVSLPGDPDSPDARLIQTTLHLLRRRRFPVHSVPLPDGLPAEQRAWLLLELGEWVALYVALLNNSDPGSRVPHMILFQP